MRVLFATAVVASVSCVWCATPPPAAAAQGTIPVSSALRSEPATIQTPAGPVFGTLVLPTNAEPVPVTLIIAGSGPTDRDGNTPLLTGGAAPLRLLAEALASRGIASLRYDKRGIAASRISPAGMRALRFDDYVADAAAWIAKLQADPRFSRVVVIGHSEGALIASIAAQQLHDVAVVTLDGAGMPAAAVIHEQLAHAPQALAASADSIMASLSAGRTVDSVPIALRPIFDPSVQQYEISWFRHDPAAELAKVLAPVLIVQGSNDAQVSVAQARMLAVAAGAHGRLVLVDSMTHELKIAGSDRESQMRTYTDASLPLAPRMVDAVAAFIATPASHDHK